MRHFSIALGIASMAFAAGPIQASAATGSADAVEAAAAALSANQFVWNDTGSGEPVSIVVSLGTQQAFVYRGQRLVAASTISSGRDGKDTPTGSYTILEKDVDHRSNLYNAARMPFMQRLTWDGVAIHAGNNPGFPASHGCIRVPMAFARKLFAITDVGTIVVVTNDAIDSRNPPLPVFASSTDTETQEANAASLSGAH
ncbi:L,D-transpeptidase family protein [uncultured Sphingomonas sp.]|uniref:L,D-transpeptidase family protein n=1 Tax=uncultured Sphingomonas sp. TaxID=158754 RepID=UPI0035CC88B8